MNRGFWDKLPKPIFAMAPLYDVTDAAFRRIIAKYGKPDVFYTEFVSTDGLMSAGREKLIHSLWFDEIERPIVAQIFGTNPEKYEQTAALAAELGFDGVDINMGCPDKGIIKTGSCAGLFHTPELARDLVLAAKRGAPNIPVSVKIRIGDTKVDWENWIETLLQAEPAAIAIHLRTRKEMSKVDAHWEEMPKIVQFINENTTPETRPIIIGNGDVKNLEDAMGKIAQGGCDGAMLGRAIFGNPWLFSNKESVRSGKTGTSTATNATPATEISREQKLATLLEHVLLFDKLFKGIKPFDVMKHHFKAYINGFDGAAELRAELYECKTAEEVTVILANHSK